MQDEMGECFDLDKAARNLNVPGALYPAESGLARVRRYAAAGR